MRNAQRYSFIPIDVALGEASFRPYLPLTLIYQQSSAIALQKTSKTKRSLLWKSECDRLAENLKNKA